VLRVLQNSDFFFRKVSVAMLAFSASRY